MALIKMGNDEFILYLRKKTIPCKIKNDRLGRLIWEWLRDRGAVKTVEDQLCYWGDSTPNTNDSGLPKSATQFEFDRCHLIELYDFLDKL